MISPFRLPRRLTLNGQALIAVTVFAFICLPVLTGFGLIRYLSNPKGEIAEMGREQKEKIARLGLDAVVNDDRDFLAKLTDSIRKSDSRIHQIKITNRDGDILADSKSRLEASRVAKSMGFLTLSGDEIGRVYISWDQARILSQLQATCWSHLSTSWFACFFVSGFLMLIVKHHVDRQTAELNEAIIERDAAQQQARARRDFLSLMSHEIRTPLNSIIGFSRLLENARLRPEEKEYLESIESGGDFLLQIVNDILDLSKIEAGGIQLEEEAFDIRELTDEVGKMMSSVKKDSTVRLDTICFDAGNYAMIGDRYRLKQVMVNLLSNAIKFTTEGRIVLRVGLANQYIENGSHRVRVRFEVADTGIGMTEEQLTRIFNPFAQADVGTTRQFGGTGLGLTIARNFVEAMGGSLEAMSVVDEGSLFYFTIDFPTKTCARRKEKTHRIALKAPSAKARQKVKAAAKASNLRILVAEDETANRTLISKFFKVLGYPVEFAKDGRECVELLENKEKSYDAIFLDLHMPFCHGMDIAGRLKDGEFGQKNLDAKLAIMSADVLEQGRADEIGIDAFISKPINMTELKTFLESVKPQAKEDRPSNPLDVLVVEDQELNRKLIAQLFGTFGVYPNFANDGIECFEYLETHPRPDMIFLDLRMPRMDGWTVTEKIRSGEAGKEITDVPIAILSAEVGSRSRCIDLGVNEFIPKPFDATLIREFVNRVQDANEYTSLPN